MTRRLPPPWRAEKFSGGYVVRDANGFAVAYVYGRAKVRVGTTHRSIAAVASAWLRRNVRQLCDGGPRRRIMYFETVDSATSNPSFSSSPWIRGAPHNGFSLLIRRMRSRSSWSILGLPGRPWDFQR